MKVETKRPTWAELEESDRPESAGNETLEEVLSLEDRINQIARGLEEGVPLIDTVKGLLEVLSEHIAHHKFDDQYQEAVRKWNNGESTQGARFPRVS